MTVESPNILLIGCESMDGRVLGHLGYPGAVTPNLDRLAAQGVSFSAAYCNSPICNPSRSSMWTGRYPHEIGCWNNYTGLKLDAVTFATLLAQAGYRTGDYGRRDKKIGGHSLRCRCTTWGRRAQLNLPENGPHDQFVVDDRYWNPGDRINFDGETPRNADLNLVDWLAQAAGDSRSFIGHFGMGAAHTGRGYAAPRRFVDLVPADTVRLPPRETHTHPALINHGIAKNCPNDVDDDYIRACRRHYYAYIAEMDELVGDILDECEVHGLFDNTWIIFISDHGDMQMEHGCLWGKGNMYDAAIRVPIIIRPPGGRSPLVVDRPVSLIDLLPTFCEIAGLCAPDNARGHSLVPDVMGGAPGHPGEAFVQYHNAYLPGSCFALRRDRWKYTVYEIDGALHPQLFDIVSDPDEMVDLVNIEPETAAELDAALQRHADIDAVIAENTAWDRRMFKSWRASLSRDEYVGRLRKEIYGCWGQEFTAAHLAKLEAWMDGTA